MLAFQAVSSHMLMGVSVALGLGLLIGVERERAKGQGPDRAAAGVRTFTLLALAGAMAQLVGPTGIAVGGAFVALAMYASYRRTQSHDPGLTTEISMLATFLLGILAMVDAALAAGLGAVVALVLAGKTKLHRFSRERLTQQELHDALLFVAAACVVLPLLPDRTIDAWHALNPRRIWILVVAVMGVGGLGHIALRAFGSRIGLAITGLAGGFVSSTATIAAMGDKAKANPGQVAAFASAGLISNVATITQLAVVMGTLSPALLARAVIPLMIAGGVALLAALVASWRAFALPLDDEIVAGKRPFEPAHALTFAVIVAGVMLIAAIAHQWLGRGSLPWLLALGGLADVHAAAASAAQMVATHAIDSDPALFAVAAAVAANSLTKCAFAWFRGGRAYAMRVIPGVMAMVVAFYLAIMV